VIVSVMSKTVNAYAIKSITSSITGLKK